MSGESGLLCLMNKYHKDFLYFLLGTQLFSGTVVHVAFECQVLS